jgi:hypothetical protein
MKEDIKKAYAQIASKAGDSDRVFAEIIQEVIEPRRLTLDYMNLFLNTRYLNEGDTLSKRVKTRARVLNMVPGTNHMASQISLLGTVSYTLDSLIAKVIVPYDQLRSGDIGTIQDLIKGLKSDLIDGIVVKMFNNIASTWTPYVNALTGSHFIDATVTGLTPAVLTTAIEKVSAHAGSVKLITGLRSTLLPMYDSAGIIDHKNTLNPGVFTTVSVPSILEEWTRFGVISTYKGATVFEIPQIQERSATDYDKPLIPNNIVLVIGDSAGSSILYGQENTQEFVDYSVEPPNYSLSVWRKYGIIIDRPENIVVIKVS